MPTPTSHLVARPRITPISEESLWFTKEPILQGQYSTALAYTNLPPGGQTQNHTYQWGVTMTYQRTHTAGPVRHSPCLHQPPTWWPDPESHLSVRSHYDLPKNPYCRASTAQPMPTPTSHLVARPRITPISEESLWLTKEPILQGQYSTAHAYTNLPPGGQTQNHTYQWGVTMTYQRTHTAGPVRHNPCLHQPPTWWPDPESHLSVRSHYDLPKNPYCRASTAQPLPTPTSHLVARPRITPISEESLWLTKEPILQGQYGTAHAYTNLPPGGQTQNHTYQWGVTMTYQRTHTAGPVRHNPCLHQPPTWWPDPESHLSVRSHDDLPKNPYCRASTAQPMPTPTSHLVARPRITPIRSHYDLPKNPYCRASTAQPMPTPTSHLVARPRITPIRSHDDLPKNPYCRASTAQPMPTPTSHLVARPRITPIRSHDDLPKNPYCRASTAQPMPTPTSHLVARPRITPIRSHDDLPKNPYCRASTAQPMPTPTSHLVARPRITPISEESLWLTKEPILQGQYSTAHAYTNLPPGGQTQNHTYEEREGKAEVKHQPGELEHGQGLLIRKRLHLSWKWEIIH